MQPPPLQDEEQLTYVYGGGDELGIALANAQSTLEMTASLVGDELPEGWQNWSIEEVAAYQIDLYHNQVVPMYESSGPSSEFAMDYYNFNIDYGLNYGSDFQTDMATILGTHKYEPPDLTLLVYAASFFIEPLDWALTVPEVVADINEGDWFNAGIGIGSMIFSAGATAYGLKRWRQGRGLSNTIDHLPKGSTLRPNSPQTINIDGILLPGDDPSKYFDWENSLSGFHQFLRENRLVKSVEDPYTKETNPWQIELSGVFHKDGGQSMYNTGDAVYMRRGGITFPDDKPLVLRQFVQPSAEALDIRFDLRKNYISVHNHPEDVMFSIEDISETARNGWGEMQVVTENATYIFKPNPDHIVELSDVNIVQIENAYRTLRSEIQENMSSQSTFSGSAKLLDGTSYDFTIEIVKLEN